MWGVPLLSHLQQMAFRVILGINIGQPAGRQGKRERESTRRITWKVFMGQTWKWHLSPATIFHYVLGLVVTINANGLENML